MIVRANVLPPTTEGSALRAGWKPQVVNGVVPDLSGLGKTGTPVGRACYESSPYYGSVLRNFGADSSGFSYPCTLGVTTTATWGLWTTLSTLALPGGTGVALQGNSAADYIGVTINGVANTIGSIVLGGVQRVTAIANTGRVDEPMLTVLTYDGDKLRGYVDGVLWYTSPSYGAAITNWNAGTGYCGYYSPASNISFNGSIRAPFVLNRCWSDADVAAYYSLAKQACYKSDWGSLVTIAAVTGIVGQYISNTGWQSVDVAGSVTIDLETVNGKPCKVLRQAVTGYRNIAIHRTQMKQDAGAFAFGELEFWYYNPSGAGPDSVVWLYTGAMATNPQNSYYIYFGAGGVNLAFYKRVAGVDTLLFSSLASFPSNTWAKITLKRLVTGAWYLYVNDVLVTPNVGTNPVTDTAFLALDWFSFSSGGLTAGQKLCLGAIDGSNAFVKRLKSPV